MIDLQGAVPGTAIKTMKYTIECHPCHVQVGKSLKSFLFNDSAWERDFLPE